MNVKHLEKQYGNVIITDIDLLEKVKGTSDEIWRIGKNLYFLSSLYDGRYDASMIDRRGRPSKNTITIEQVLIEDVNTGEFNLIGFCGDF